MATFNPTTTEELIQAIQDANASAEADTINLDAGATYTITGDETGVPFSNVRRETPQLITNGVSGLPSITSEITINGNGATIEREDGASENFRLFYISSDGNLTLDSVTLQGGRAEDAAGEAGETSVAQDDGGAILNRGTLTITDSIIQGNEAADDGGAIANEGGTLTATGTQFLGNVADGDGGGNDGGGAIDNNNGTLTIGGNTFSGNSGADQGGAFRNRNGGKIVDNDGNIFRDNQPDNVFLEDPDPANPDPPFNTVPGPQDAATTVTFQDDGTDSGNAITVNDPDSTNLDVTLTTDGTLNLGPTVSGDLTTGGDGTDTITLSGTIDDINEALDGLEFVAAGTDGTGIITITSTDETSLSDTDTITIGDVVTTIDAVDDQQTTETNTAVTINILDNDTFGTLTTIELVDDAENNGTIELNDNGTTADFSDDFVVFTPNTDFVGGETFSYTITDETGSDTAQVSILVGTSLLAVDDEATTEAATPVTINILDNDFFTSLDNLEVNLNPENGTVEILDNGTPDDFTDDLIVYTPNAGFDNDIETFDYTISSDGDDPDDDSDDESSTATVTVTVGEVITTIDAVDDSATTALDTPVTIDILDNDTFGTLVTIEVDDDSANNGTVELNDNGTTADFSDDFLVFTPNAGFDGFEDFNYTITDETGSDTATVVVEVGGDVIATLDAVDDLAETEAATPVTINILDNDNLGTGLTQQLTVDDTTLLNGTVEINDNGTTADFSDDFIVYTPDGDFEGVEDFNYTITDGTNTDTAEVTVSIGVVDTSIDAVDDEATTDAATPVTVSILDNDTFGTLSSLEIDLAEVINGTVEINDNGTTADFSDDFIVFTPDAGFTGVEDFSYTITDDTGSDAAQVSITVGDVTATIIDAVDDIEETTTATPITIDILDNDTFDTLDSLEIGDLLNGTVEVIDSDGIADDDLTDDVIVYTPNATFRGVERFDYTITSGDESDSASVTITVDEEVVVETIDAVDDRFDTDQAVPITIDILDNDTFDADTIEAIEVDFADIFNGTVEVNDNGTTADFSDDFLVYTPDADFDGIEDFEYTITDATGSDTATVVIGVNEVVTSTFAAVDDTASGEAGTAVTIDILDNDVFDTIDSLEIDFDDLLNATVEVLDNGTPDDFTDDVIVYTPNGSFRGIERFDYTITSGDESDSASVTVTIAEADEVNQPPVAGNDTATTDFNTPVNINVLANDSDPDGDDLTLSIVNQPDSGTVEINDNGTPTDLTDDFITYTPDTNFSGEDTFVYQVDDGNGGTDTATVTVTVGDDDSDVVLSSPTNNVFPITGSPNQAATLKFTLTDVDAALVNQIGVFEVDDDAGAIGTLEPGDSGYITAALNSGQVIFSALSSDSPNFFDSPFLGGDPMRILSGFNGSDRLGFYLIPGSTSDAVLSGDTSQSNVLLGFASGGAGDVLTVEEISDGLFQLSFEDVPGGNDDEPFGDLIVTAQVTTDDPLTGTGLQGEVKLIDLTDFDGQQLQTQIVATKDAALNNRGGLYIVQDTDGSVIDPVTGQTVTPGQANYTEAALRNSVINFNNVDPDLFNLSGGFLYAPYMQVNGDSSQTLFAFNEANPNGFDASRLLADNTFGFEDAPDGTELSDYNDFAFQVIFAVDA
ncbi:MAG: Ig-like domain-containing protein [Oscillatoria sp. PMC 1068.18]|nr:Ig-like domain-containing protein [Oscillatoria sp. PMC 1076.18]MEC4987605.1 Ig-like domain-containing protein [Oscillatoria sp. PMC 1068.18]